MYSSCFDPCPSTSIISCLDWLDVPGSTPTFRLVWCLASSQNEPCICQHMSLLCWELSRTSCDTLKTITQPHSPFSAPLPSLSPALWSSLCCFYNETEYIPDRPQLSSFASFTDSSMISHQKRFPGTLRTPPPPPFVYYIPGTLLKISHINLIFTMTLWGKKYESHFIDEKHEAQCLW